MGIFRLFRFYDPYLLVYFHILKIKFPESFLVLFDQGVDILHTHGHSSPGQPGFGIFPDGKESFCCFRLIHNWLYVELLH